MSLEHCAYRSFFFQAEDGIRDLYVTGVQTCALPISLAKTLLKTFGSFAEVLAAPTQRLAEIKGLGESSITDLKIVHAARSEERRVGKECRARWAAHY